MTIQERVMKRSSSYSGGGGGGDSRRITMASLTTQEGIYRLLGLKCCPDDAIHLPHLETESRVTFAELKEKTSLKMLHAKSTDAGVGAETEDVWLTGSGRYGEPTLKRLSSSGSDGSRSIVFICIINVGFAIYISDLNTRDKYPIKSIRFSSSNPTCHAFDAEATDGHDLVIGMHNGDAYSVSLRNQLLNYGSKQAGARCYSHGGSFTDRCKQKLVTKPSFARRLPFLRSSKGSCCTCIAWVPNSNGDFVVAHDDGNLYVYKNKLGVGDPSFPTIEDKTEFTFAPARNTEANPTARWHICERSINSVAFSNDGAFMATVGRDGYLRVFDYANKLAIRFCKSFCSALLCCAWSADGMYILAGGADDKVHVWSMVQQRMVAWGKGHRSFVVGVAFDPYWPTPSSDDADQDVMYRFGSVGLDAQLIFWNLKKKDIKDLAGKQRPREGFHGQGSSSSYCSPFALPGLIQQPSPRLLVVRELHPSADNLPHRAPLSGLIFTQNSVLTSCRDGVVKIWKRPGAPAESRPSNEASSSRPQPARNSF